MLRLIIAVNCSVLSMCNFMPLLENDICFIHNVNNREIAVSVIRLVFKNVKLAYYLQHILIL